MLGPISLDLSGFAVGAKCPGEEPSCRAEVAARRDEYVDDLPVLVDGSVDVAPFAGNRHVGLVDEPTVTYQVAARPRRIREERSEALHPSVDGDVIDLDPTLTDQLFNIPIGQPVPQIPTEREDDDRVREPEPGDAELGSGGNRCEL